MAHILVKADWLIFWFLRLSLSTLLTHSHYFEFYWLVYWLIWCYWLFLSCWYCAWVLLTDFLFIFLSSVCRFSFWLTDWLLSLLVFGLSDWFSRFTHIILSFTGLFDVTDCFWVADIVLDWLIILFLKLSLSDIFQIYRLTVVTWTLTDCFTDWFDMSDLFSGRRRLRWAVWLDFRSLGLRSVTTVSSDPLTDCFAACSWWKFREQCRTFTARLWCNLCVSMCTCVCAAS